MDSHRGLLGFRVHRVHKARIYWVLAGPRLHPCELYAAGIRANTISGLGWTFALHAIPPPNAEGNGENFINDFKKVRAIE